MPENILTHLLKRTSKQQRIAFFSAVIIGLLCHLYIMVNYLPNHDGTINIYNTQKKYSLGRFLLSPLAGISSYFDLTWVNGWLAILYLACTAFMLVALFNIKKNSSAILMSALIVTFPVVSSTFGYMFTADGYMLATLFTVIAIYMTNQYKHGWIAGIVLFFIALATYQANLPFMMTLVTMYSIQQLVFERNVKQTLIRLCKQAFVAISSLLIYFPLFKWYQSKNEITDYQGLSEATSLSTQGIGTKISLMIEEFNSFFFAPIVSDVNWTPFDVLNVCIIVIGIAGLLYVIVSEKVYKHVSATLLIVLFLIALPFLTYSLYFVSENVSYHMLMVYSHIAIYLLPILIYDRLERLTIPTVVYSWGTFIIVVVTSFNFMLIANISYFNATLKYEKSTALAQSIYNEASHLDGFMEAEYLYVDGRYAMDATLSTDILPNRIPEMTGLMGEHFLAQPYHYQYVFRNHIGHNFELLSDEADVKALQQTEDFKTMGVWPAKDAVKVINDVLVINFRERTNGQ